MGYCCCWQLAAANRDLLSVCQQLQTSSFCYGRGNIVFYDSTILLSGHVTLPNLLKFASLLGKQNSDCGLQITLDKIRHKLLPNSTEQNSSFYVSSSSASQEIFYLLWNLKFLTVFTRDRHCSLFGSHTNSVHTIIQHFL